jgi:hypothetical protein
MQPKTHVDSGLYLAVVQCERRWMRRWKSLKTTPLLELGADLGTGAMTWPKIRLSAQQMVGQFWPMAAP